MCDLHIEDHRFKQFCSKHCLLFEPDTWKIRTRSGVEVYQVECMKFGSYHITSGTLTFYGPNISSAKLQQLLSLAA